MKKAKKAKKRSPKKNEAMACSRCAMRGAELDRARSMNRYLEEKIKLLEDAIRHVRVNSIEARNLLRYFEPRLSG